MSDNRFKEVRKRNNISIKELSEILNVTQEEINELENGKFTNMDIILKYAKYFNISCDYLLGVIDKENTLGLGTKHGEKFFKFEDNQIIWETYFNNMINAWDVENKERLEAQVFTEEQKAENIKKLYGYSEKGKDELTPYKLEYKKKKMSVQQYKPILLEFEKFCGKSFNEISKEDIDEFIKNTKKKNRINHFLGFLRSCVADGIIVNRDTEFLIRLLPEQSQKVVRIILEEKSYGKENCN